VPTGVIFRVPKPTFAAVVGGNVVSLGLGEGVSLGLGVGHFGLSLPSLHR
jgi:hypothetical protein